MAYKILVDSACDLTDEQAARHGIGMVYYYVTVDQEHYQKDRVERDLHSLYTMMNNKVYPKTSMPSMQDYMDAFTEWLAKGQDVLCLTLTSKFSSSYQCAVAAQYEVQALFPDRKIFVVDSQQATFMYAITAIEAVKLRDAGVEIDRCVAAIEAVRNEAGALLSVDSLDFLVHGGRVGKVMAIAGGLFNIKPVIGFTDGELFPLAKARGRKKSFEAIVEAAIKNGLAGRKNYSSCVMHCEHDEEALELTQMLRAQGMNVDYDPLPLGSVISSHIGPTTVAYVYATHLWV
jgi:DegV family protein with EDD domain